MKRDAKMNEPLDDTDSATRPPASVRRTARLRRAVLAIGLVVWGAVVVCGMGLLADYAGRPGTQGTAPEQIAPADGKQPKFRLSAFIHPRCPCTAATLRELANLTARLGDRVEVVVYLYRPEGESDAWTHGSLRDTAASIPGVRPVIDPGGRIAERFGSKTSGDMLLYDETGRLRYHGGITAARGHEGDNLGKSAILSIVLGDGEHVGNAPVFGCALEGEPATD